MAERDNSESVEIPPSPVELAARAFLRRQAGDWSSLDQADLEQWLLDPACAEAYRTVQKSWWTAGDHANSPLILQLREEAKARARQRGLSPWTWGRGNYRGAWAAGLVGIVVLGATAMLLHDDRSETAYETGIGEGRLIELKDHSRLALDAKTRVVVRLSRDSRVVELSEGQAQFMVASDPRRPFRVEAGAHTITAVGTSFNVEYEDLTMQVAMVEGKVAVSIGSPGKPSNSNEPAYYSSAGTTTDLVAGQELRVDPDGKVEFIAKADVAAAVMWRQGKIILKDATLSEAVRRINRYSRIQIVVEGPQLEALRISGIFDAGDTKAFIEAIQSYFPVVAVQDGPELIRLRPL